ncbi:HEAT repeat domain-containing protein [Microcella sp.]|uniref:HEAT repeat domain-containing protein n=1 Tax=Microcella sp. TaxID=1913979 RepID=UPI00391A43C3
MPATDDPAARRLAEALTATAASMRQQAALTAGTHPRDTYVPVLVARCAVDPDLTVRESLTWALLRHDPDVTLPALTAELASTNPQARSQALHTLSKIGDTRAWPAITRELIDNPDLRVARTAWRAASRVAPEVERAELAVTLTAHLGVGDWPVQRALTDALLFLGDDAAPALAASAQAPDPHTRAHALATQAMRADDALGFDVAIEAALREVSNEPRP